LRPCQWKRGPQKGKADVDVLLHYHQQFGMCDDPPQSDLLADAECHERPLSGAELAHRKAAYRVHPLRVSSRRKLNPVPFQGSGYKAR
jgi:hypothetical protein